MPPLIFCKLEFMLPLHAACVYKSVALNSLPTAHNSALWGLGRQCCNAFVITHAFSYPKPPFAISVRIYQHHATKITRTMVTIASSDCEINPNNYIISLSGASMGASGCPRPSFGYFCSSKSNIPKR